MVIKGKKNPVTLFGVDNINRFALIAQAEQGPLPPSRWLSDDCSLLGF